MLCQLREVPPNRAKYSAGASLNEAPLPNDNIWPSIFGDLFLVVFVLSSPSPSIFWRLFLATFLVITLLQNNNRHTSARAQKISTVRNMRPLSIREAPRPGDTGGPSTGSGYIINHIFRFFLNSNSFLEVSPLRLLAVSMSYHRQSAVVHALCHL